MLDRKLDVHNNQHSILQSLGVGNNRYLPMSFLITVTLTPKPGKAMELVQFSSGMLLETLNSLGCIRAQIFSNLEEEQQVILLGEWDSYESYQYYLAKHIEKGDFEKLLSFLKHEPQNRYLSDRHDLVFQVKQASERWSACFNNGDAAGCAALYEEDAEMRVTALGTFKGRTEIEKFWADLIDDGHNKLNHIEPFIEVADQNSAILTSEWSMNKANGVITKQLWKLQDDGNAKLRVDEFKLDR